MTTGEAPGQPPVVPEVTPGSDQAEAKPASSDTAVQTAVADSSETCTTPTEDGHAACMSITAPSSQSPYANGASAAPDAGVDPPQWCEDSQGKVVGTRTQVCQVGSLTYTTYRTVNGQRTTTGQANMIVINYSYGDTGLPTIAHQIEVSAYGGWGDALNASVDGQATLTGACKRDSHSFPSKPLKPLRSFSVAAPE
ncbi:hypothetical protein [Streptomyces griseorubiginosus]|uniref:hypothetical protein n=1 Tax=Streptomyces griseorubiginosus TaxID=67304 RepID=UPI0036482CA5